MAINSKTLFRRKTIGQITEQMKTDEVNNVSGLKRVLTVRDLTALGIAAILGAGIFSTVGKACYDGGPGVIFLFVISAVVCGFSALCYAEFASRIPISGSAYTYSYASFGELIAWIIGWDLIIEYAIGNITVAISWASNLKTLLNNMNITTPDYLFTSFFEAKNAYLRYLAMSPADIHTNLSASDLQEAMLWQTAPHVMGIPFIINIPAFIITAFITLLVYVGIKESRTGSNLMVAFKVLVVLMVIAVGFFYVRTANWHPFMPKGMGGVMRGVSAVFFAYIGFDAITTTAEECKNPQRDLPRGMFYSLIICTVLYILVALVITGMVNYTQLNSTDFLANAFLQRGLTWLGGIIALSAVVATTSVLLVFQLGQPRIWMSMSRDGLLPPVFGKIHPKYKTPAFATIITGLLVGIPSLVLDSDFVTDLTSIGTLFAFILVCGGILFIPHEGEAPKFKVPYINGRYLLPIIFGGILLLLNNIFPGAIAGVFKPSWSALPYIVFSIFSLIVIILSVIKKLSLIPIIGLLSCAYLMTELGILNWLRFFIWLVIGMIIYFLYGIKHSRLKANAHT